ncbi:hypothetical protein [Shewanella halifaxensis]|uniref:hypothetical protein n=1 Tax=Shewanella halifaxensis TaxID=271098 RepID=UPI00167F2D73|nr:hypothetical protein [Shewanella halifaxensis]
MTKPLYDVYVTAAFVNLFTSDVMAELTGPIQFHTEFGISSVHGDRRTCNDIHI